MTPSNCWSLFNPAPRLAPGSVVANDRPTTYGLRVPVGATREVKLRAPGSSARVALYDAVEGRSCSQAQLLAEGRPVSGCGDHRLEHTVQGARPTSTARDVFLVVSHEDGSLFPAPPSRDYLGDFTLSVEVR